MSSHLGLFEVRLASSLSQDGFVLAARSDFLRSKGWVEKRARLLRELLVRFSFEFQHLQRVEWHQVVEVSGGHSLYLFEEGGHVRFILERELHHSLLNRVGVELELEFHVVDVRHVGVVVGSAHVHTAFVVLSNFLLHVASIFDSVGLDPRLDRLQALACSELGHVNVGNLEKDRTQALTHEKVVIFEFVPLGFRHNHV